MGKINNMAKKYSLIKQHMIGDVDTTSGQMETLIPTIQNIIPQEKAKSRSKSQLM